MEPPRGSTKPKDQAAKKSSGAPRRKAGQADKPGIASQQFQAGKNAQQTTAEGGRSKDSDVDRKQSVMGLSEDMRDVDAQALPGTAIAENSDERHQKISAAAYARAERRGFEPGREEEDWLSAEAELYGDYTRDGEDEDENREQQHEQQRNRNDRQ